MIAYRPVKGKRGSNIPQAVVDTAVTRHPDGFGVAWREGKTLHHVRFGPKQKAEFVSQLRSLDKRSDMEYVAHWRYATHGPEDEAHAHPYSYVDPQEGRVLVFHNGIIDIATTPQESDTEVFTRDVLAHLPSAWWRYGWARYLVGQAIGWSRLVLMTDTETVNLQESSGNWDNGIWYSSNHKPAAPLPKWTPSGSYGYMPSASKAVTAPVTPPAAIVPVETIKRKAGKHKGAITVRNVRKDATLYNAGHKVTMLVPLDRSRDGDYPHSVICDTCNTFGDVYVIDGGTYIDMSHRDPGGRYSDDRDEEQAAALLDI